MVRAMKKKQLMEEEIRHQLARRQATASVDLEFDYHYNDA